MHQPLDVRSDQRPAGLAVRRDGPAAAEPLRHGCAHATPPGTDIVIGRGRTVQLLSSACISKCSCLLPVRACLMWSCLVCSGASLLRLRIESGCLVCQRQAGCPTSPTPHAVPAASASPTALATSSSPASTSTPSTAPTRTSDRSEISVSFGIGNLRAYGGVF